MSLSNIIKLIEYHISKNLLIKIERINISDNEIISGFPIKLSNKFLLMTVINDFHNEGFTIIRVDDITDAYSSESDKFYEKICISEGLRDFLQPEFLNDLSDYEQILNDLKNYDGLISIQCEAQIEKCTFYLGKIIEVQEKTVKFLSVGAEGEWDDEMNIIPYTEITQISFGDNYSKMFYKHISAL